MKKIKYKDYLYDWLLYKQKFVKESTYATYSNTAFNYIIPNIGNYYISDLNYSIIQNFVLELYEKGLGLKTIKDISSIVKSSVRDLQNTNKIKFFNLNLIYPKINYNKNIHILSKQEQDKIVSHIYNDINNKNVGILISLFLGIRIGELCALKWSDIDFENSTLIVSKTLQRIYIKTKDKGNSKIVVSTPKTSKSYRTIPINSAFLKILRDLKNAEDNYILTGTNKFIEPRVYRNFFNNLLKKLNLSHFTFHCLRHTFATNCINLGMNYKTVSELLGHSNVNITFNLYVHPSFSQKKKCIDILYNSYTK